MTDEPQKPAAAEPEFTDATEEFEEALAKRGSERYLLRLYVAGTTPLSRQAIASIKQICEQELAGRYDLEVVDVYQDPSLAEGDQIIAVPTLVKRLPTPLRKLIGDLSSRERILVGLDLRPRPEPKP